MVTSDGLGSRSYFIIDDHPSKARLKIQKVTPDDEGIFRCRVDFINSPTRNFEINLTLVGQYFNAYLTVSFLNYIIQSVFFFIILL